MNRVTLAALGAALLLSACKKEAPPPLYEPMAVARRDIIVSAEAAGSVEPILVVQVKSRASGQILQMRVETGDVVHRGDTLVMVDRRDPTNTYNQADADLEVARAQLATAEAAKRRSDQMFQTQLISEQDKEQADLAFANARAQLVRAEVNVQNARDQLNDCNVIAPVDGVIIQKNAEVGQVITSAVRDVSGGTVLLQMADLSVVQVRTLVDETDIGKIQPGMRAQITVDAYPNRPFDGTVLKIEPQSTTNQNVTMFPVLIRIGNENGLLRPGMNAEVEIQVAQTRNVLAIPNAALRTNRDVGSAAQVLGLNPDVVMATLARADSAAGPNGPTAVDGATRQTTLGGSSAGGRARSGAAPAPAGASPSAPTAGGMGGAGGGFQMPLPEGVTQEQWNAIRQKRQNQQPLTPAESTIAARVRENFQRLRESGQAQGGGAPAGQFGGAPAGGEAQGGPGGFQMPAGFTSEQMRPIFEKFRSGQPLSAQEQAMMTRFRAAMASSGGGGQRRRFGSGNSFQFGGTYIVFVLRGGKPSPVRVRTGVTDMDYSEVRSGLTEQDTVLLLPSASLVQSQQDMRDRFQRMTGGGGVPGMRQQVTPPPSNVQGAARPGAGR
jgi:HlyD family secretion protein